ncbi:hypothetical protein K474DRAFT_1674108 [Panus rudis PR-1116 ss-1]|nr:hypothetical protein K474DRAFT_1674108 [Panus rudis PR-1116 ss-1]
MAPKLANVGFFSLNAVRALSIITLLLLFSSSIVTLVTDIKAVNSFIAAGRDSNSSNNSTSSAVECTEEDCDYIEGSTVPNQPAGAFWAVLNRLLIIFQAIILIMSEIEWPLSFFDRFFPILGSNFGLGALGIIQALLGAAVLSHHVDEFSLVSAFFLFSVGCLNMLLGLIFRERAKSIRSIKAWRASSKDVLPTVDAAPRSLTSVSNTFTGSSMGEKGLMGAARTDSTKSARSGMGFGRQGQKAAEARGYVVQEPEEALPTYVPKPKASSRASSPIN